MVLIKKQQIVFVALTDIMQSIQDTLSQQIGQKKSEIKEKLLIMTQSQENPYLLHHVVEHFKSLLLKVKPMVGHLSVMKKLFGKI